MSDLPGWAFTEEQFAEFCERRGMDETGGAWALYERWINGDDEDLQVLCRPCHMAEDGRA